MKLSQLKIDPEFQSKIPPLQFEEEQQLEQNIIAEGRLLNPIITWNGYILDGHTRYRILKKHGFIKFEVEEIQLANKYEALAWISQRGHLLCRHGAAYRLGTGRETPCGSSAEQHWKPSFAYIDRCNCYHPDGKEEKTAHPCAGGFQPGL